jgi:hypothetical protein
VRNDRGSLGSVRASRAGEAGLSIAKFFNDGLPGHLALGRRYDAFDFYLHDSMLIYEASGITLYFCAQR